MSDLYNKIIEDRGRLENLVARIPGFKGYQDKQARRTADRMLRDYISGEIQNRIDRLVRIENKILDRVGMGYMTKTRDAKTTMQIFHDRIATAAPPYDGMFAQIKITSEDLARIYSFDEHMIRYADRFDAALDAIEAAISEKEKLDDAIYALQDVATEANDAYKLRDDVLTNLSKTL